MKLKELYAKVRVHLETKLIERLIFVLLIAALVASAILFFEKTPVNQWDEIHVYLGQGSQPVLEQPFDAEWSPLYIYWYSFLSLFTSTQTGLLYLNMSLVPFLNLLAWYGLLRTLRWSVGGAALAVLLIGAGYTTWLSEIKVHHFSLFLSTVFAILILRLRDPAKQLIWGFPAFSILVLTRPELVLLFPVGAIVALIYFLCAIPRHQKKNIDLLVLSIVLSFSVVVGMGLFNGKKSGETYFKKHWERLGEIRQQRYPSEIELQQDLFPNSNNAIEAFFDNPQVFLEHSRYHLNFYFSIQKSFLAYLYEDAPVLFLGWAVLIFAGLVALFMSLRSGKIPDRRSFLTATYVLFLIAIPHLLLTLIYGTLARYNVATFFVLMTACSAFMLCLPRAWQNASALLGFLLFFVMATDWRDSMVRRNPEGFVNHFGSFERQISPMLAKVNLRVLTDCGTIWTTISRSTRFSESFEFMLQPGAPPVPPIEENLKNFNLVILCDDERQGRNKEQVDLYQQFLLGKKNEFRHFHFMPINAEVFIRSEIVVETQLPPDVKEF